MKAQEEQRGAEELQRRIEERRRQAFERESHRLDAETERQAHGLLEQHESSVRERLQQQLTAAHEQRRHAEEALHLKEEEIHTTLQAERQKKFENRRREEDEMRRRSEDERKRKEEFARRRAEEEERRKSEQTRRKSEDEERKRREEEARHKAEAERRRREEELRRQEEVRRVKEEEERKRRDEEQRKKGEEAKRLALEQQRKEEERAHKEEQRRKEEDERRQRMESQITKARAYFAAGDFEHASVEVAKALVNDPMNVDALDLEAKVNEAQSGGGGLPGELPEEGEEQPAVQQKPKQKTKPRKKKPTYMLGQKQQKAPSAKRNPLPIVIGLAVTAVIVGVVMYLQLRTSVAPSQQSFTILPWTSTSNSLEESLIGSALAEEVTERFERLPSPTGTGFATSYLLTERSRDPQRSVFQLGSMYALEGKVTRTGDTIAVALQLVDSLGKMAWSDGFMKSIAQLSELPDEIATRLAIALGIPASSRPESFTAHRALRNGEAYQYYLRGLEMRHRRTAESQRNALSLFEQAVQIDPKFAEAFAEASDILTTEYEEGWTPYDTAIARARQLAESAVAADPAVSRGYVALARALALRKEYREALANAGSALQLSPSSADAYRERGLILLKTGSTKEALEAFSQAVRLNPRDPWTLRAAGLAEQVLESARQSMAYHQAALAFSDDSSKYIVGPIADAIASDPDLLLRHSGQVITACEHNIAFTPSDYYSMYRLGRVKQLLGKSEDARKLLAQAEGRLRELLRQEPKNAKALTFLALTLTRLGKFPDAIAAARRAVDLDPRSADVKYGVAQMYSLQMYSGKKKEIDPKKKEEALKQLKQALTIHYRLDALANADFFNMRDLPEYAEIIRESAQ